MTAYLRILATCIAVVTVPGLANAVPSTISALILPPADIPELTESAKARAPIILAQAADPTFRLGQLEERIRVLNGRIEEMNFQMLQMQEQMRQMQEDNEFRFQELEGGNRTDASQRPAENRDQAVVDRPAGEQTEQSATSGTLGTITFDQNGELVDGELQQPSDTQDQTQTASLPNSGPEQLYQAAYGYVLSGDYPLAEAAFGNYISQYPEGTNISDAYYWLGEAQYSQGAYHEAAKTLLSAHKQYPNAAKAPEMLLKLGMSLAALDNRDTACATYREVLTRYPDSSDAVKNKVAVEQSRMSC
ncbi:tol-pal system protein YbgF [Hoeflea sp. TYP-13]|uniref:tol-pal system protein YbgF n=1 Tax=Hoeflea sp. TYP-13 TaxID=3230023 RepID=UPI0034C6B502